MVITHALGPHFTDLHLNDAPSHGQDTVVPYIKSISMCNGDRLGGKERKKIGNQIHFHSHFML